jgi:hypothetical protein
LAELAQDAAACRRLGSAVALLAIDDAEADPIGPAGRYLESPDFFDVAELAGIDADAARARIAPIAAARLAAARAEAAAARTAGASRLDRGARAKARASPSRFALCAP